MNETNIMNEEIQIRLIGGIEEWVNIFVREISNEIYLVLENDVYSEIDWGTLFEFYPGDTIIANSDIFPTDEYRQGVQLISPGVFQDRKYLDFLFQASIHRVSVDENTLKNYANEIARVRKEISEGKSSYRGVRMILESIDLTEKWAATKIV